EWVERWPARGPAPWEWVCRVPRPLRRSWRRRVPSVERWSWAVAPHRAPPAVADAERPLPWECRWPWRWRPRRCGRPRATAHRPARAARAARARSPRPPGDKTAYAQTRRSSSCLQQLLQASLGFDTDPSESQTDRLRSRTETRVGGQTTPGSGSHHEINGTTVEA